MEFESSFLVVTVAEGTGTLSFSDVFVSDVSGCVRDFFLEASLRYEAVVVPLGLWNGGFEDEGRSR